MLTQLLAKKTDFPDADASEGPSLKRTLGPWGLTALGIGAVIGGGIFVITGQAAAEHAGPAIVLAFIMAAVCCSFTALCYAEFATLIPMVGQFVFVRLRDARRRRRLVHRLEHGARIRRLGIGRGSELDRLLHQPARSHGDSSSAGADQRTARVHRQSSGHHRRAVQSAGGRDRPGADLAVLRRHPRIERRQYGDGHRSRSR